MAFLDKLTGARRRHNSRLCLSLDVVVADTPLPIQYYDEPMLPFAREIIAATADLVCAYAVNPGYFLAEGAAGMVALERIVRVIPDDAPLLFDGRFADDGALSSYLRGAFEQYRSDAATLGFAASHAAPPTVGPQRALIHRLGSVGAGDDGAPHVWIEHSDKAAIERAAAVSPRCAIVMDAGSPSFPLERARAALPQAVFVVGSPILYASRRITFADDARSAAVAFRDRFGG